MLPLEAQNEQPTLTRWSPPYLTKGVGKTPSDLRHRLQSVDLRWGFGFLGLLAYFVVEYMQLPLSYPILQPLALGKVTAGIALLGWIFAPKSAGVASRVRLADMAMVILLFAVWLCTLSAEYTDVALKAFVDVVRLAIVYFIISRLVNSSWRLRAICFVWLLLNFKIGQFVCRTYATWHSAGVDEMSLVGHGVGGTGFFGNSADLGVAMCVIWPVAVCLLYSKPKGIYRLLLIGASVACLGAIFLCGSRGAVVGAVAIGAVALVKNPQKISTVVMIILLGIALWLVLPDASKQRFQSARNPDQDQTAHHRLSLWKAGIRMWENNPILGVGLNNFALVRWSRYPIDIDSGIISVAHSTYIQGISELGLVGMIPILILWIAIFRLNAGTRRKMLSLGAQQRRSFEYCLATGLDFGLIGYLASGTFVSVLWYPHTFVLLGFSAALNHLAQKQASAAEQPAADRVAVALA
jgi:O-antigen ligase